MVRRRKPAEVLDASGLTAVTEFNQWLRGLDAKALVLWQTASSEARDALANAARTGMMFAAVAAGVLAAAVVVLAGGSDQRAIAVPLLGGAGAMICLAGFGSLRGIKARHDEAARTRLALEYKLGFLHQQLEGDDISPTGATQQEVDALLGGRQHIRGFDNALLLLMVGLGGLNIAAAVLGAT